MQTPEPRQSPEARHLRQELHSDKKSSGVIHVHLKSSGHSAKCTLRKRVNLSGYFDNAEQAHQRNVGRPMMPYMYIEC